VGAASATARAAAAPASIAVEKRTIALQEDTNIPLG